MKISVITPTYNRAGILRRSLDSVLSQTFPPHEHIIIDNLSSDDTATVVQTYASKAPYQVVYVREADTGIYQAMNKGVAKARGEAISILNDDDALHDAEVLQILSGCMTAMKTDLVYGDVDWLNPITGERSRRRHNQVNKLTLIHKGINQVAMLHHATLFQRCGFYDETYRIAGDHEWLLRAFIKHDISGTYLRRPVAICSLGGVSNAETFAQRRREERNKVNRLWFSQREIDRSRLYRRIIRRLPFGTPLFDLVQPLKLRIKSVRLHGARFTPDLAARLGF